MPTRLHIYITVIFWYDNNDHDGDVASNQNLNMHVLRKAPQQGLSYSCLKKKKENNHFQRIRQRQKGFLENESQHKKASDRP